MHLRQTLSALSLLLLVLGGCAQRSISITSQPPGALVWLNDVEVGRTPVEVSFKWYGTYDVRLALDGYEPVVTSREANAPVNEWPGIDLITAPLPLHNRIAWHFDLSPTAESIDKATAERDLIDRARAMAVESAAGGEPPQSSPR